MTTLSDFKEQVSREPAGDLGKRLYHKAQEDELTTRAAAFAYHWMFAIPPLLILAVMVGSLLNRLTSVPVVENLRDLVRERAPANAQDVLLQLIDNAVAKVGSGAATFGLLFTALLALWAASSGVGGLMDAFNRFYGVEQDRPFVRKKLVAIGLTLLLAVSVNLVFAVLVFGRQIGDWIAGRLGLGAAFDVLWALVRWPLAIGAIVLVLALLYDVGPNVDLPIRWFSPGAVVATALWLIAVLGFGLYLRFADPGSAYGVLGGVIVLMFFLYVTGIVFLLGAEVNALLERGDEPATSPEQAMAVREEPSDGDEARRRRLQRPATAP